MRLMRTTDDDNDDDKQNFKTKLHVNFFKICM